MPDYSQAKIYKIYSNHTNKIYIGSTTLKYLSTRLAIHKQDMKREGYSCSSFKILKYSDAKIILLETYPCNSKDKLNAKEQEWVDENKDICVNKQNCIPITKSSIISSKYNRIKKFCEYCGTEGSKQKYKNQHCKCKMHKENVKFMNKL